MRRKDEERRAEHSVTADIAVAMFRIISELRGAECTMFPNVSVNTPVAIFRGY
jgi:hypothetical protein